MDPIKKAVPFVALYRSKHYLLATIVTSLMEILLLLRENGFHPLLWPLVFQPGLTRVTLRIRNYVIHGKDVSGEAWKLKESYRDPLALEAVAAAIIAQISISMLGLDSFGNVHWAATAFAYASLVCGVLSTFSAFLVQQALSELHRPEDVRLWLVSEKQDNSASARAHGAYEVEEIPSVIAATILTAPGRLLALSIVLLFVALGTYLGEVYTRSLGALEGVNVNRAVLLFFIFSLVTGFAMIDFPLRSKVTVHLFPFPERKDTETRIEFRGRANPSEPPAIAPSPNSGTGVVDGVVETRDTRRIAHAVLKSLKVSIRAQQESLKAQKAFLKTLDALRSEI